MDVGRKDFADYTFIVREIESLYALGSPQEMLKYLSQRPADALSVLLGSDGKSISCTYEGAQRFRQIVNRGLDLLGVAARRHDAKTLTSALKRAFASNAAQIVAETTETNAHELFLSVLREVEATYQPLTHHIPCSLAVRQDPARFTIGPVNFTWRELFMNENEKTIRECLAERTTADWEFQQLEEFFVKFNWVASVRVPACDSAISADRARSVIRRSLDLFKLFVGSKYAARVIQGYELCAPQATAGLVSWDDRRFGFSRSYSSLDALVPDGWHGHVSTFEVWGLAEWVISSVWEKWDQDQTSEPYQRFLDALAWHGDAISEPDAQARTLKLWTSIERLVGLRGADPVVARAALLGSERAADFARKFLQAQRLYTMRSNIVHGRATHKDIKSTAIAHATEELSKRVLFAYLLNVVKRCKATGDDSREILSRLFKQFDAEIKAAKRASPSVESGSSPG